MQTLAEAFFQWQDSLAYEREVQQKVAACLQRWRTRDLAIAFDAFFANAIKQRQAKAVSKKRAERLHLLALMLREAW